MCTNYNSFQLSIKTLKSPLPLFLKIFQEISELICPSRTIRKVCHNKKHFIQTILDPPVLCQSRSLVPESYLGTIAISH